MMSEANTEIPQLQGRKSILPASSVDRRLISSAAKHATAQEMSDAVMGQLTPAQAIDRVKVLIESATIFDEIEDRKLLMWQMQEHLTWLSENRENDKVLSTIPRMFKLIGDLLEKSHMNVSDLSTKLARDHAEYFISGFMVGFEKMLKTYSEQNEIVIEEEDIMELAQLGVEASKGYIETVTQYDTV